MRKLAAPHPMLSALYEVERNMGALLDEAAAWKTLLVDYEPPVVERVWRPWRDSMGWCRVYLHCIHPCDSALYHAHPWPSAMRVLEGRYEMGIGTADGVLSTLELRAGSAYEMTRESAHHYVKPLGAPIYSLMVTGEPWSQKGPKPDKPLGPLDPEVAAWIVKRFRRFYGET